MGTSLEIVHTGGLGRLKHCSYVFSLFLWRLYITYLKRTRGQISILSSYDFGGISRVSLGLEFNLC